MVPLPLGPRGAMGPGNKRRSQGLQPLVAGCGETGAAALAAARGGCGQVPPRGLGEGPPTRSSVRAHSETVVRGFYEFHREAGTGPIMNPFPLDRSRRGGRANVQHNPMEPYRNELPPASTGRGSRPGCPEPSPTSSSTRFFARLPSNRDRALVAFYVSTGVRASELLSPTTQGGVDPGRQLVSVVRKGSRQAQELPGSVDAFVWLRLYQVEMEGLVPDGRRRSLCGRSTPVPPAQLPSLASHVRTGEHLAGTRRRCTRFATPLPTAWPKTRPCP